MYEKAVRVAQGYIEAEARSTCEVLTTRVWEWLRFLCDIGSPLPRPAAGVRERSELLGLVVTRSMRAEQQPVLGEMTGVGEGTVRRYLQLLDLADELQEGLAAGEVKNTEALARLAKKFTTPEKQLEVWKSISGFRQDVQLDVLKGLDTDLSNLEDLRDMAAEGALGVLMIRNCPFDCPTIPEPLKKQVAAMIESYPSQN